MDILLLEKELRKRLAFPYRWHGRQSDKADRMTAFIYRTANFEQLRQKMAALSPEIQHYAYNRWLNFWSAKGVEHLFRQHGNVEAAPDPYDKKVDFTINGIPFDHKTSVFPKAFPHDLSYAQHHKQELIRWLYEQQSQEGRLHFSNRLFLILYNTVQPEHHWKLKAELSFIAEKIAAYLRTFELKNTIRLNFGQGVVFSDIVWIVK